MHPQRLLAIGFILVALMTCDRSGTPHQKDTVVAPPRFAGRTDTAAVGAAIARAQSKGLEGASFVVRRAFVYRGNTWLKPESGERLVAVEAVFSNASRDFDLDDLDIVDASTGKNFGSDPDIGFKAATGTYAADPPSQLTGPIDILLVYSIPATTKTVRISYWGSDVGIPRVIESAGPSIHE